MFNSNNKQLGVTLIELLLVLAIIIVMILLSINQVQVFRFDSQIRQIQYNVNNLFEGLSTYYKANCFGNTVLTTGVYYGTGGGNLYQEIIRLAKQPPLPTKYSKGISISGDLAGFLPMQLLISPIINQPPYTSESIIAPYKVQFNLVTYSRQVCTYANTGPQCNSIPNIPMATVVTWQAQVAVKLPDGVDYQAYLGYLGGDCLSSSESSGPDGGETVEPCQFARQSTKNNYVVWQRQPSLGGSSTPAEGWLANPLVTQFTQEYQTAPGLYLTNTGGNVYPNFEGQPQYLQCTD